MIAPTTKQVVSSRFGKFRPGDAGNFGSGNQKPHAHDGLDFSTDGHQEPVFASTGGVITVRGSGSGTDNRLIIKRANGEVVQHEHLSGYAAGMHVAHR